MSALAHEGRLSVFRLLVKAGPEGLAAGDIARRLDVLPNTLSANLNVLADAGLIGPAATAARSSTARGYDRMRELLAFLMEDCCGGSAGNLRAAGGHRRSAPPAVAEENADERRTATTTCFSSAPAIRRARSSPRRS